MFEGEDLGVGLLDRPEADLGRAAVGSASELFARADRAHRAIGRAQLELLRAISEVDRAEAWVVEGARDIAHWVWMRYGISGWKALRWVACARVLEDLPGVARALGQGELSLDKVVELTRFATAGTEQGLVSWAQAVSTGAIRHRGDLEARRERAEVVALERERSVRWWYHDEGRRFSLCADLPAASGAVVAGALAREASRLPVLPTDEHHPYPQEARWADALVGLCSARVGSDPDPDRATVVLHAPLEALTAPEDLAPAGESTTGAIVAASTVRRLVCNGRVQVAVDDARGDAVALGRLTRVPSAAQVRLVRHRDRGCVFPGCGSVATPRPTTSGGGVAAEGPTLRTWC